MGAESISPALETLQSVGKWLLEISASRYVKLSQHTGIGKISSRQKLIAECQRITLYVTDFIQYERAREREK